MQLNLPTMQKKENELHNSILEVPIEELNLSVRAYNVLKGNGLDTIKDVISFGLNRIIKLRSAGIKSVKAISDAIAFAMTEDFSTHSHKEQEVEKALLSFEEVAKKTLEKKLLNASLKDLNLSLRTFNALKKIGIETVHDILNYGLDNIGKKTSSEIKSAISMLENQQQSIVENITFREAVDNIFANVSQKNLPVIEMRYGYADGKRKTLEEIGNTKGLTRERIRQIILKEIRRITHYRARNSLELIIENIERLLFKYKGIIGIKDIFNDKYFSAASRNHVIFVLNLLADIYEEHYRFIDKYFFTSLNDNEIKNLHGIMREAALKCKFPIEEKTFINNIISTVGSISEYYLSYYLLNKERIQMSKGMILSPGGLSMPQRIKLLLSDVDRPMHFSEIAELYKKHFGEENCKASDIEHAIHARIGDSKDFIIIDPGTFLLKSKFKLPNNIDEIIEKSGEILRELNSISDTKFLIEKLKQQKINLGSINAYSLKPILLERGGFVSYHKFEIGLEEYINKYDRKPLNELIFELFESLRRPLHVKTIWKEILKQRGFPEYAVSQKLADDPRFIRIAPATYTIASNIEQYEEKRIIITNFAKEWVQLKGSGISAFFVNEVLKASDKIKDLSLGIVEHVLATSAEFVKLPDGFYNLKTQ
ncbi:MAG: hypothetical protein EPN22_08545 [Nitrospirae bacterium]|nr:MAG: hypothetical protein EPN22_08545 [Nitrospirota bacterium]